MKLAFILLCAIIATAAAFPSAEAQPKPTDVKAEVDPEGKVEGQKNALLEVDANPVGDNQNGDRAKRFFFVVPYSYPLYYSYPVSRTTVLI